MNLLAAVAGSPDEDLDAGLLIGLARDSRKVT